MLLICSLHLTLSRNLVVIYIFNSYNDVLVLCTDRVVHVSPCLLVGSDPLLLGHFIASFVKTFTLQHSLIVSLFAVFVSSAFSQLLSNSTCSKV